MQRQHGRSIRFAMLSVTVNSHGLPVFGFESVVEYHAAAVLYSR